MVGDWWGAAYFNRRGVLKRRAVVILRIDLGAAKSALPFARALPERRSRSGYFKRDVPFFFSRATSAVSDFWGSSRCRLGPR